MDAEIVGSYFEEMLQTSRRLVWPPRSVSPRHLYKFWLKTRSVYFRTGVTHVLAKFLVFGTLEAVNAVLAKHGWQINTAFVERLNLDIRQRVAAVRRRVLTLCQGEDGMRQQLVVFQSYHNFCLPHASLRQPLLVPAPTNGTGSARQWQPRTPAMAAGLTDQVWTLREVLLFRVPPWPQLQAL
jgi:hypothetical protein